eukprot:5435144-Pleurochrysis_carterae.AAC.1
MRAPSDAFRALNVALSRSAERCIESERQALRSEHQALRKDYVQRKQSAERFCLKNATKRGVQRAAK